MISEIASIHLPAQFWRCLATSQPENPTPQSRCRCRRTIDTSCHQSRKPAGARPPDPPVGAEDAQNPGDSALPLGIVPGSSKGSLVENLSVLNLQPRRTWDPDVMLQLISPDRMSRYLESCDNDLEAAFSLYRSNAAIATSLLLITGMVEVIFRNSIDQSLVEWADRKDLGMEWFDVKLLSTRAKADIRRARKRLQNRGKPEVHSRIVAELPFGFWRYLTAKRYLTELWVPAIHHAFPHGNPDIRVRRAEVSALLEKLNVARNRAAHLEPVYERDLHQDYEDAHTLLGWISPEAAKWFCDSYLAHEHAHHKAGQGFTTQSILDGDQ